MSSDAKKDATSNVFVEEWRPLDSEVPTLHHLPFKIGHTGYAQVSKYLVIKDSKTLEPLPPVSASDPHLSTSSMLTT